MHQSDDYAFPLKNRELSCKNVSYQDIYTFHDLQLYSNLPIWNFSQLIS